MSVEHLASGVSQARTRWAPAVPTIVFETYWRFAAERQRIYFRRLRQATGPWTDDPILAAHKFTNAYRAADRISQYLIRNVIGPGHRQPENTFFRILLFKIFNKVETWELLQRELGDPDVNTFSVEKYCAALDGAFQRNERVFSAAYIMPSGAGAYRHPRKHRNYLELLDHMLCDDAPGRLRRAGSMRDAFEVLRGYPLIGDFLAYQFATDLNYSDIIDFSEMTFVVAGPGARDGIRKCFSTLGGLTCEEVILRVAQRQSEEFACRGIAFEDLWGRRLQLVDCQNLFCETDKYARIAHPEFKGLTGRTRIKQVFRPKTSPPWPWFPPKWDLNDRVGGDAGG